MKIIMMLAFATIWSVSSCAVLGQAAETDAAGALEHPLIQRYPGQTITWQEIDNYREFRVPVGPVTGYRKIDDWVEMTGLVTRTLYTYRGTDRTASEIFLNYKGALEAEGFELLASRFSEARNGREIGSGQWLDVYLRTNPWASGGEANTQKAGTAGSGGAGAIVATKDRAAGRVYVVVNLELHDVDYIGALIDIVEVAAAETGLVVVDAEAIGSGIFEEGRVVLDGIFFEFDSAKLKPESSEALRAVVEFMNDNPDLTFYVVGHTDSKGARSYNMSLSKARADAVAATLIADYSIAPERIEGHGVGPLAPVFTNTSDAGRERNRRVELVER
ncbi:MAG: OmpA family protein [Pseudomonadota bacterium]